MYVRDVKYVGQEVTGRADSGGDVYRFIGRQVQMDNEGLMDVSTNAKHRPGSVISYRSYLVCCFIYREELSS